MKLISSVDYITPEWLTHILCRSGYSVRTMSSQSQSKATHRMLPKGQGSTIVIALRYTTPPMRRRPLQRDST
jgi:hypothetical protein